MLEIENLTTLISVMCRAAFELVRKMFNFSKRNDEIKVIFVWSPPKRQHAIMQ